MKARTSLLCAVMVKTRLPKQTRLPVSVFPLIRGKFPKEHDGEGSVCETGMRSGDGLV